jgi:hypothetical protein
MCCTCGWVSALGCVDRIYRMDRVALILTQTISFLSCAIDLQAVQPASGVPRPGPNAAASSASGAQGGQGRGAANVAVPKLVSRSKYMLCTAYASPTLL